MGRSVSYLSNASQVAYLLTPKFIDDNFDEDEESEEFDYVEWDDFIEDVFNVLQEKFPTLEECDKWDGRETRIFAENNLAEFGISEYCGLTSISVRPKDWDGYKNDLQGLAENWCNRINLTGLISSKFDKALRKIGTFSNGEGVYEKVN